MELRLPQTHVYALKPSLDFESAKQQAFDKRVGVVAGGLGGLLSRPSRTMSSWSMTKSAWSRSGTLPAPCATSSSAADFQRAYHEPEVRSVTLLARISKWPLTAAAAIAGQPLSSSRSATRLGLSSAIAPRLQHPRVGALRRRRNRQERYLDAVNGQVLSSARIYVLKDKTGIHDLSELALATYLSCRRSCRRRVAKSVLSTMEADQPIRSSKKPDH